mgnify:CR=1 FL=1
MNIFIEDLKNQEKVCKSVDKSRSFRFMEELGGNPVISGPCSVESREMILDFSKALKDLGITAIRAGAYKPCTFPIRKSIGEWKEGIGEKGLDYLSEVKSETGLKIVSEIMDPRQIDKKSMDCIDVIQVGTRNFQNYSLLDELGSIRKPVLLKRGTWGTLDEILGACERVISGGNEKIAICLRGVVGMPSYRHIFPTVRWAPDIMMIPALKEITSIPVIYDPSHSTGYSNFVVPISKAAIAAGADGLIVESHPDPKNSISDAAQAISTSQLQEILRFIR